MRNFKGLKLIVGVIVMLILSFGVIIIFSTITMPHNKISEFIITEKLIGKSRSSALFVLPRFPTFQIKQNTALFLNYNANNNYEFFTTKDSQFINKIADLVTRYRLETLQNKSISSNAKAFNYSITSVSIKSENINVDFSYNPAALMEDNLDQDKKLIKDFMSELEKLKSELNPESFYSSKIEIKAFKITNDSTKKYQVLKVLNNVKSETVLNLDDEDHSLQKQLASSTQFQDESGQQYIVYYVPVINNL